VSLGSRRLDAVLLIAASAAIVLTHHPALDYGAISCHLRVPYCDDPKPVLDAVTHGHFGAYFHEQSLLGPVSILLRLPFVGLANALGGGKRLAFDLGAFACLLTLAGAAYLVGDEMDRRGVARWKQLLVQTLIVVNPVTFRALYWGRPEEAVGSALCIAAAVSAIRGRAATTGALAAAAVATKLWGVLALVPLLSVLRADRRRALAAAGLTLVVLYGPLAVGDPDRLSHAVASANNLGTIPGTAAPTNAWWFAMDLVRWDRPTFINPDGTVVTTPAQSYVLKPPLGHISHSVVLAIGLLLAVLWARRRPPPDDVLLLLALILLLRCVLDPNNFSYYHLPFLACLIAWEGIVRGVPWLGILSAACLQAIISITPHVTSAAGLTWIYLAWAVPTLAGLALILCRRSRSTPPTQRSPISPRPATA